MVLPLPVESAREPVARPRLPALILVAQARPDLECVVEAAPPCEHADELRARRGRLPDGVNDARHVGAVNLPREVEDLRTVLLGVCVCRAAQFRERLVVAPGAQERVA